MFALKLRQKESDQNANSLLRVAGVEIFFDERFSRPHLRERMCVSERSMQRARFSRNLFIRFQVYSRRDVPAYTIRKNTNRRESYEGGGISSSPIAIARARVCIRHDIPTLQQSLTTPRRQARSSFPWNVRVFCPKSDRDTYMSIPIHMCLLVQHAYMLAKYA